MQLAKYALFQARLREDEPAIAFAGGVATYGLLARAVESAVARLRSVEIPQGEFVAFHMQNPFRHALLIFAAALYLVITVPLALIAGVIEKKVAVLR